MWACFDLQSTHLSCLLQKRVVFLSLFGQPICRVGYKACVFNWHSLHKLVVSLQTRPPQPLFPLCAQKLLIPNFTRQTIQDIVGYKPNRGFPPNFRSSPISGAKPIRYSLCVRSITFSGVFSFNVQPIHLWCAKSKHCISLTFKRSLCRGTTTLFPRPAPATSCFSRVLRNLQNATNQLRRQQTALRLVVLRMRPTKP